jgi:hypothetical protein
MLFFASIDSHALNVSIKLSNITANNALFTIPQQSYNYLGANGHSLAKWYGKIRDAIPEHSVVSTPEGAMALLYHNRTVEFYPVDIDRADYVVLSITAWKGKKPSSYGGAISYRGVADELKRIDAALEKRMRRHGYDFEHATIIPERSVAIVRRCVELAPHSPFYQGIVPCQPAPCRQTAFRQR